MPLLQLNRTLASFATLLLFSLPALAANPLQVKTDKGKVEGAYTTDKQVIAFKGIPYAAPPVGDLRWQPPQPAAKWKGVRSAANFGSHCVQSGGYPDMVFHDPGPSEDCLTLNVWAPANAKPDSKLPVMVWIYGGGFTTGGTSENRQDGQFLAHRNTIIVSMNYRLGIFGFFVHPELTAESPHHASGNYGLMDQTAAVEWTKRNIAAFGGDPSNITIFGESAGSFAVSTLMASPQSRGLISKAIGESGGALYSAGLSYPSRESLEQRNVEFAQTAFGTSKLADLRKLSADDLVKAATAKTTPPPPRFGPDVDGYFLPESVPAIYAAGQQAHVPLLAGWNADEARGAVLFAKPPVTAESFTAQADKEFGDRAKDFLAVYPATTDAEALASAGDFASDRFIAFSTWRWIEAQILTGNAPVYRYFFTLGNPGDQNHKAALGAFHSDDIEYVFGTLDSRPGAVWRPEDRKLSDQMGQYWTNFARTGNPNGPGLPNWPTSTADDQYQVMHLNANPEAQPDTLRPRYLFLDSVWGKPKP
ncbi:carboxylesterase/lipase family protein [Edaphobacter dinghuensis]|uniref:Carboxylic ester hydrolase n=1 Tax=Edaphobacter dinghuensis TaxID=1560005 RepID=A0A917M5T9_9BACT|nr:carboxylesterase family protein [Edaphobacter dinghuensis]GGG79208.1 carboxylic ester hydrolase [Edaphobacter dinghuensis]